MHFAIPLASLAALALHLPLALCREFSDMECALCPLALAVAPNHKFSLDDLWTDEHGRCPNDPAYHVENSTLHDIRCDLKLGDNPPWTISPRPHGDGIAPVAYMNPKWGVGPSIHPEALEKCGVPGKEITGIVDQDCVHKWLNDREEAAARAKEPCLDCGSDIFVVHYEGGYTVRKRRYLVEPECNKCCRENGTINRVGWYDRFWNKIEPGPEDPVWKPLTKPEE